MPEDGRACTASIRPCAKSSTLLPCIPLWCTPCLVICMCRRQEDSRTSQKSVQSARGFHLPELDPHTNPSCRSKKCPASHWHRFQTPESARLDFDKRAQTAAEICHSTGN